MTAWARIALLGLLLALAPAASCEQPPAGNATTQPALPTVQMQLGTGTFTLEVADEHDERQAGLMHRTSMPPDHGMIFVFPEESDRSFWMRNTLIPLDIVYVDAGGRVVSVKQMKPLDETPVPSDGAARFAIELNAEAAAKAGVMPGMVLRIPARAQTAVD